MLTTKMKRARLESKLTQQELGMKVGVTKATIGRYEKVRRKPSYDVMLRLSDVLHMPGDELLELIDDSSFSQNNE